MILILYNLVTHKRQCWCMGHGMLGAVIDTPIILFVIWWLFL